MEDLSQNIVQQNRHASKMPNRKYAYFRDDQIMVLVKHPSEPVASVTPLAEITGADSLEKFTNAIYKKYEVESNGAESAGTIYVSPLEEFTKAINQTLENFPREAEQKAPVAVSPQVVSFPPLTEEQVRQSMDLVAKQFLTSEEAEKIRDAFSIIKYDLQNVPDDPSKLLEIILHLNNLENKLIGFSVAGFTLAGTVLNWLTSITSQSGGTGGPGGRPFPYFGNRKTAPYCFDIKKQLEATAGKGIYGDGSGVDVVILDTAPCAQDLVLAYKEWPDHPLISTLLGPEGKLHLYPATYEELLRMSCTSLNDYDYKMTDHGLFIAGIIHSIVPEAEIHLIEVLNQFGVGDFQRFAEGLNEVLEKIDDPARKLVVNCSWILEFPRDDGHCSHKDDSDPDAVFEQKVLEFSKADQSTLLTLESLFNRLYGLGRQAIAAAGNDGRKVPAGRVEARYPAALKRVTGVGALPKSLEKGGNGKYLPSGFSNLADTPEKNGIVTFGGEEGEGKGVLGLYIGEFPDCSCNESKWAWWAGTSFATPILTGAVASVLSREGNDADTTQAAIKKLYATGAKVILDGQGDRQQDALPVTQS